MRWYLIHVKHFTQRLIENKYLNVIIFPVSTTAGSIEENILRCHRIPITTRSLISKPSSVVVFFPPGYVALWDSKTPHRPAGERVSCCLETSPPSRLPPQDGSPSLTLLSLFLSFIFCPTSFPREEWAASLGAWCPPPESRSCFVEVSQHSHDLLMNLWGRKWSPHPIPLPS